MAEAVADRVRRYMFDGIRGCSLMHQPDPLRTLRRITGLLRPGGWLVAQEALRSPAPRSHPHLDALSGYWNLQARLTRGAREVLDGPRRY